MKVTIVRVALPSPAGKVSPQVTDEENQIKLQYPGYRTKYHTDAMIILLRFRYRLCAVTRFLYASRLSSSTTCVVPLLRWRRLIQAQLRTSICKQIVNKSRFLIIFVKNFIYISRLFNSASAETVCDDLIRPHRIDIIVQTSLFRHYETDTITRQPSIDSFIQTFTPCAEFKRSDSDTTVQTPSDMTFIVELILEIKE